MKSGSRLSFYAGMSAIGIYLVFTLVAFLRFPGSYGPLTNWLSDLGNPLANPSGAPLYNLGCVLAGLFLIPFFVGLGQWNTGDKKMKLLLTVAQISGILSSVFLIVSAIYPLGTHTSVHSFVGKMHIVFLGFFLTFSATALMRHGGFPRWMAYFALLAAGVNFVYGAVLHSVFVAEWLALGMFVLYVLLIAYSSTRLFSALHPNSAVS